MKNLEDQIFETIRHSLGNVELELTSSTPTKSIKGWDSLSHVRILVALEKKLKFNFTTAEVVTLQSQLHCLSDIIGFVRAHLEGTENS